MKITAAWLYRAKDTPFALETLSLEEPRGDEVFWYASSRPGSATRTSRCATTRSILSRILLCSGTKAPASSSAVGAGVTKVKAGDPVILTCNSCGHCPSCVEGMPVYCYDFNTYNFSGTRPDGTSPLSSNGEKIHYFHAQSSFATHSVARERSVVRVSKDAPLEASGAARLRRDDRFGRRHQFHGGRCRTVHRGVRHRLQSA